MLSYLADFEEYFGPLRLLRYITVRTVLAALTALIIGFVIGPILIRRFRELKLGHGYIDDRTGALVEKPQEIVHGWEVLEVAKTLRGGDAPRRMWVMKRRGRISRPSR